MITEKQISEIISTIVKNVNPKKIIIFGSFAKGKAGKDSDLDLVVIWDTDLSPHKRNVYLCRLFPERKFSLDIFSFTEEEMGRFKGIPGTLLYEALNNGKVVYG